MHALHLLRELMEILEDDETPVFVCYEDENSNELLGYCFSVFEKKHGHSLQPVKTLYLDDICVDEKARGKHVGTVIFEHVKEFAKKNGCYDMTLNVWEGNDSAKAFYEAMGFKVLKYGMEIVL